MNLNQWILFEERLRQASDIETFQMIIVNLLQQVFPYTQAILFEKNVHYKTQVASNISEINEYSPTIQWLNQQLYPYLDKNYQKPTAFNTTELGIEIAPYYQTTQHGIFLPLHSAIIGKWGAVFWLKEPASKDLLNFMPILASSIIHTWEKLILQSRKRRKVISLLTTKQLLIGAGIILVLLSTVRIKQSTVAPAEISPKTPILIAPSISGSISEIKVQPNETVKEGQVLFKLDDINLLNQLEESEQALNVAKQRYLKAYRHAFTNEESRQQMQILEKEQEQALVTYQYQKKLLERTEIKSPKPGVALYSDPRNWLGKPVKIGEKVMLIANPAEKEIIFWIPMDNMIEVDDAIPIQFYSNENPTQVTKAKIAYINPIAEARPDGVIAYFGVAQLNTDPNVHLGEQGTIKVFGKKVSLIYYLLRRPLRYFRQHLGV